MKMNDSQRKARETRFNTELKKKDDRPTYQKQSEKQKRTKYHDTRKRVDD